jgi:hypothetical protein
LRSEKIFPLFLWGGGSFGAFVAVVTGLLFSMRSKTAMPDVATTVNVRV